jgi:hypothetical protein
MNVVGASLLAINPITNHKPSLAGKLLQSPSPSLAITRDLSPNKTKQIPGPRIKSAVTDKKHLLATPDLTSFCHPGLDLFLSSRA